MAKYKKLVFKTVEEWLEARKSRIGGSEVSSIMGLNHFRSAYKLYCIKTGQVQPDEENERMRWGHYLEDGVAMGVEKELGFQIIKNTKGNVIYLSEDYPFAEASPDRIAYLPGAKKTEDNKCIVEIKTTVLKIDEDTIPLSWVCQVQWYMGITGIHKAIIAWLSNGKDFGYKTMEFDADFFKDMTDAAAEFVENMKNGIAPIPVTAEDLKLAYPKSIAGTTNSVSEDVALTCEEYKQYNSQIKELEAKKKACETIIKAAIADAEAIEFGGLTLATYKSPKESEKFDSEAFIAENADLAKKYMKITQGSRKLLVK